LQQSFDGVARNFSHTQAWKITPFRKKNSEFKSGGARPSQKKSVEAKVHVAPWVLEITDVVGVFIKSFI